MTRCGVQILECLVCFPFAGGGAQSFREWSQSLPPNLQLCAVQRRSNRNGLGLFRSATRQGEV